MGRSNSISKAAEEGLAVYIDRYLTAFQREMIWFLWEEFEIWTT
jgi:hypothetical protein